MNVKRGDLIRVKDDTIPVTAYKAGGIYEVLGIVGVDDDVQIEVLGERGIHGYLDEDEFEVYCRVGGTKAQKGDLIRITDASSYMWENGDIFEVVEIHSHLSGVTVKGGEYIPYGTFVIHRKAGEEDAPKIKRDGFRELQLQMAGHTPEEAVAITMQDAVNPQHYKQGRVEVIDIIEDAVEGADPFEAVCQANVLKYALRYRHKNGVEDLKKAVWYAEKLIAYLDAKSTQD